MNDTMTPRQIKLVQESFTYLRPLANTLATLFYLRLFELAPSLKSLFHSNLEVQARKLMQSLEHVVRGLENFPALLPELAELGRRHVKYGVQREHYDLVGEVLLWALARALTEDFTNEVEAAWRAAYALIANAMKAASNENAFSQLTIPR